MRYALHRVGETKIFQMLEVQESDLELIPAGIVAVPVGLEVSDSTHVIVDGKPVLKPQE